MVHSKNVVVVSFATLCLLLIPETRAHFLSIEDLEEFYDLEEKLVTTFTSYIEEQKEILEVVKQRYEEQKRWRPVLNNTDEYLSNPLNVHALLKRLISDWPLTLALLGGSFADDDDEEPIKLPTREEYRASVHSIGRLQQVYNFTIAELVSGSVFSGTDRTSVLTADDCLAVARDLYENRHYDLAVDWLNEALAQATNHSNGGKVVSTGSQSEQPFAAAPIDNILEYLALASCFKGDQRKSRKYFNKLYTDFPDFRPTQGLIKDHLLAVNDSCRKLINNESLKPKDHHLNITWSEDAELSVVYGRLCRNLTRPSARLQCHIVVYQNPFWLLNPFKLEELSNDPVVFLAHDVTSLSEREFLMNNMQDEDFLSMNGFVYEFWKSLPENASVSEQIVRRVDEITGVKYHNTYSQVVMSTSPVGAEYKLAHDAESHETGGSIRKEREVTTELFLEEPQAGGYIVFPRIELSVAPVAGAALVWFNLDKDGDIDKRVIYGSCPIIQGRQTTVTLWSNENVVNDE